MHISFREFGQRLPVAPFSQAVAATLMSVVGCGLIAKVACGRAAGDLRVGLLALVVVAFISTLVLLLQLRRTYNCIYDRAIRGDAEACRTLTTAVRAYTWGCFLVLSVGLLLIVTHPR